MINQIPNSLAVYCSLQTSSPDFYPCIPMHFESDIIFYDFPAYAYLHKCWPLKF